MAKFEVFVREAVDEAGNRPWWAEDKQMLQVFRNDVKILEEWDGGEPEDNSFDRDWSWVQTAIEDAYYYGCQYGYDSAVEDDLK